MSTPVTEQEIDPVTPQLVTVGASEVVLSPSRLGRSHRIFFSLVPITPGVTATLCFGEGAAAANMGVPLNPNQPFVDCAGDSYMPYQGALKVVASGAGQVAFVERFEQ